MLGHGLAVDALRTNAPSSEVGVTLNLYAVTPADESPGAVDAARRIDGVQNRWFLDPILRGSYPEDVRDDLRGVTDFAFEQTGDAAAIAAPLDFLGVNYYTRHIVRSGAFPGSADVEFVGNGLPRTSMGWEIDEEGLVEVLARVDTEYGHLPIVVT
jgi:beta-glucosidase